jgi:hypothetical protein
MDLAAARCWIWSQRACFHQGSMSQFKIDILKSRHFVFDKKKFNEKQKIREEKEHAESLKKSQQKDVAAYRSFFEAHGHCRVTTDYPFYYSLISVLRFLKHEDLFPETVQAIKDIHFCQSNDPDSERSFESRLCQLIFFRYVWGDFNVPNGIHKAFYLGEEYKTLSQKCQNLHLFIKSIRILKAENILDKKVVQRLDKFHFPWTQEEAVWQGHFLALKRVKDTYSGLDTPCFFREPDHKAADPCCYGMYKKMNLGEYDLASWSRKQRRLKGKCLLEKSHEDSLNSIGFSWRNHTPEHKKMSFRQANLLDKKILEMVSKEDSAYKDIKSRCCWNGEINGVHVRSRLKRLEKKGLVKRIPIITNNGLVNPEYQWGMPKSKCHD